MIIDFKNGYQGKLAIALGLFDSVHNGHRALISRTRTYAESIGIESAVLTFGDNLYKALGSCEEQIYTFNERIELIGELGVDHIIAVEPDINLINMSPTDFMDFLTENFDIDTIFCGRDFKFGLNNAGDINFMSNYCLNKSIKTDISEMVLDDGEKISSSNIRKLIKEGDISKAKSLLGKPYMIIGEVVRGSGKGKSLGFPTANIKLTDDKLKLSEGVYATAAIVDGVKYNSLSNVGGKPTFDDMEFNVETFIIDYSGDELYGKQIKILFYDRIRSVMKHQNMEELILQIKVDLAYSDNIERT